MEYIIPILIVLAFLITLMRIEINTKKKLEKDEKIIERLDLIINEIRESRSSGDD